MWRLFFRQTEGGRGWRQFMTSSIHHQDPINKEENKMYRQIGGKAEETLKVRKAIPVGQCLQFHHICFTDKKFKVQARNIHTRFHDRGYSQRVINEGHLREEKATWDPLPPGHSSGLCSDTVTNETSVPQIDFVDATAEDYEEVMSISSGVFNGTDNLPVRYHEWLKEPQRRMLLAKCEGKVVAFASYIFVDDGSTAGVEDLRVAPWIRGRGVTGLFRKIFLEILHSDHPEVKRFRFTRAENPPPSMLTKYKVFKSKAVISVFLPADQLETTLRVLESRVNNLDRFKNVSVLEPEEILRFFEESRTREQLLPGGFLVQGWLPLTTHKSNLNLLLKRKIVWIYSYPEDSNGSASSSKVTASCDGTHAYLEGFLSLGTPPYPVPFTEGAHRLDIDMFGNHPSCAKVHVVEQLKIGVQALPAGSSIICILYADESLRTELSQLCEGLTPFHNSREQMIMEMKI